MLFENMLLTYGKEIVSSNQYLNYVWQNTSIGILTCVLAFPVRLAKGLTPFSSLFTPNDVTPLSAQTVRKRIKGTEIYVSCQKMYMGSSHPPGDST